jgi:AcrR family transcriptional regulator
MTSTEERAEQRREDIVPAAFKVFRERGYHAAGAAR